VLTRIPRSPTPQLTVEMGKLSEEMFLSAEGIRTSSEGLRLKFAGRKRTVSDGPTTDSQELIGGICMPRGEVEGRGDHKGLAPRHSFARCQNDGRRLDQYSHAVGDVGVRSRGGAPPSAL
jgi:hypothetical protein